MYLFIYKATSLIFKHNIHKSSDLYSQDETVLTDISKQANCSRNYSALFSIGKDSEEPLLVLLSHSFVFRLNNACGCAYTVHGVDSPAEGEGTPSRENRETFQLGLDSGRKRMESNPEVYTAVSQG